MGPPTARLLVVLALFRPSNRIKGGYKLKVCLKELRESQRALALIKRVPLVDRPERLSQLEKETDELIKIFVVSIRTASGPQ